MRKIAIIGIASVACLALASCQTTGTSKIDDAIQQGLPKTCAALNLAYVAFEAIAATGKIKASTVSKVEAANAGIEIICSDPEHTTAVDALVKAAEAFVTITTALQEAKAAS
jgi:hypothetical protein